MSYSECSGQSGISLILGPMFRYDAAPFPATPANRGTGFGRPLLQPRAAALETVLGSA